MQNLIHNDRFGGYSIEHLYETCPLCNLISFALNFLTLWLRYLIGYFLSLLQTSPMPA